MRYWILKSEPHSWSWDQQVKAGAKGAAWTGVRNHQAKLNLMKMRQGDRAFFYHSGEERSLVGVVEIAKEYYPDHTDESGRFGMVDVKTVGPVKTPVTLAQIKAEPKLKDLALVRQSRLSVVPVDAAQWKLLCQMAGVKG